MRAARLMASGGVEGYFGRELFGGCFGIIESSMMLLFVVGFVPVGSSIMTDHDLAAVQN